jgi:hypothetical protein
MKYYIYTFFILFFIIIFYYTNSKQINYNRNKLVYYTCFFGDNNNIANKINNPPSLKYDCYFFTNNQNTYESLKNTNWIPIFINIPIKKTLTENAMDAKKLKACPHHFDILNKYEYTCYFDSKLYVKCHEVESMIDNIFTSDDYLYIMGRHPFVKPNIWNEYNEAMHQERYAIEKERYYNYIMKQLNNGLKDTVENHYQTGFIIRRSSSKTNEINELWYKHIKECGIECQISFFFIQQIYRPHIYTINTYGYSSDNDFKYLISHVLQQLFG